MIDGSEDRNEDGSRGQIGDPQEESRWGDLDDMLQKHLDDLTANLKENVTEQDRLQELARGLRREISAAERLLTARGIEISVEPEPILTEDEAEREMSSPQKPIEERLEDNVEEAWDLSNIYQFQEAMVDVIREANLGKQGMHVTKIKAGLDRLGHDIPGKGDTANIITRLRRAEDKFVLVKRGTYGLKEDGAIPMKRSKRS